LFGSWVLLLVYPFEKERLTLLLGSTPKFARKLNLS
jgi:hypothetical protein